MFRLMIGFLSGYVCYIISFCITECIQTEAALSMKLFFKQLPLYDNHKIKLSRSMILITVLCTILVWICGKYYPNIRQMIAVYAYCVVLLIIAYIDFHTMYIPDRCLAILALIEILLLFFPSECTWQQRFCGIFAASGLMIAMNGLHSDSFGYGDIKLMMLCGFYFGVHKIMFAMLTAVLCGGPYALYLLIRKKKEKKAYMAFAPFLCSALIITCFIADECINAYFSVFF